MEYYISINSWNLLESFVTESISPFAFYSKRNFGNSLSRCPGSSSDKINYLMLASNDRGGDYTIIVDESILDGSCIMPAKKLKTILFYSKTIYYKVGFVRFRFATQALLDAFMAESQILSEVKCVEKYKSSFKVEEVKEKKDSKSLKRQGDLLSFEQQRFISCDNRFNLIKGAIVGYVRGELTASGAESQELVKLINDIKNSFAGLNTQIMVNDIDVQNPGKYIKNLHKCKELYLEVIKERTNNFDILEQLFSEVCNLASLRAQELNICKSSDWKLKYKKLVSQKQDLESQICQIERDNDITAIKDALQKIKDQERLMGTSKGKKREYFKKDTPEYEEKCRLKEKLKAFRDGNNHYRFLLKDFDRLNKEIMELTNESRKYDNAISALFSRISDIANDIYKKFEASKSLNTVNLAPIQTAPNRTLSLNDVAVDNKAEIEFFNTLLKIIIERDTLESVSDSYILSLIELAANEYKRCETATTDKGRILIECLRNYWKYKHNSSSTFCIPDDMPVLQSIMAFFIKPFGFEQIERYMLNKGYTEKKYAMMLWGACNGYAALPKTFAAILYQAESNYDKMDFLLEDIYKSLEK